jgi:hypothetical protein
MSGSNSAHCERWGFYVMRSIQLAGTSASVTYTTSRPTSSDIFE